MQRFALVRQLILVSVDDAKRRGVEVIIVECGVGPPSGVQNLTVVSVTETTVSLWWRAPADNGGRSDVWFTVDCRSCDDKFVLYRPRQAHLNDTSYVSVNAPSYSSLFHVFPGFTFSFPPRLLPTTSSFPTVSLPFLPPYCFYPPSSPVHNTSHL